MLEENVTLERIVPDSLSGSDGLDSRSLQLHLERYEFAASHLRPGRLLDIACGTGYGSHMLATNEAVDSITAVDISTTAIDYARQRYAHNKIDFRQADALSFSDTRLFNTIVSLETIEHLPDPAGFVRRLYDLLLPGGILIASAPVTPSTDGNPYHATDFSPASFRKLFKEYPLTESNSLLQVQPYGFNGIFRKHEQQRTQHMRRNLFGWYLAHPRVFFLRIQSLLVDGFKNKYLTLALTKRE